MNTSEFAPSYIISLSNGIIPLFLIFYITQFEGLELAGNYFILLSYAGLIQIIFDYGFNLGGIRDVQGQSDSMRLHKTKELFLVISIIKLFFFILLLSILIIFTLIFTLSDEVLFAIVLGGVISIFNTSWIFIGLKKTFEYYSILLSYRLLFLIPIFFIPTNAVFFLIISTAPSCFLLFHFLYSSRKESSFPNLFKNLNKSLFTKTLKDNFYIFINGALGSGIALSWPIILNIFLTTSQIGAFGFADRIVKGISMFFSPLPPLILSSQLKLSSLGKNKSILLISIFSIPLFFTFTPYFLFEKTNISALVMIKQDFQNYFFIIPAYLLNMLLYTFFIFYKKESFYLISLFISLVILLMGESLVGNKFYLPLFFEVSVLIFSMIFLVLYNKKNDRRI